MPCDCPKDQLRPTPAGGCNYLVYSGGPWASFYRLIEQAIPDVEMAHGRPTAHADGSLTFPGPPPVIPGYRAEGSRLYPIWPLCTLRMLQVQVLDGVLSIAGICGDLETGLFSQEATPDQCRNCTTRQAKSYVQTSPPLAVG